MSNFGKAFEAGRDAFKKRRTVLLFAACAFMALDVAIHECVAHRYLAAALAVLFFLIVMPWLGWAWIKPRH
jgi:hypothetical protein